MGWGGCLCGDPARAGLASSSLVPQVLQDCQRHRSNIREIGDLWVGGGVREGLSTFLGAPSRVRLLSCLGFHSPHVGPSEWTFSTDGRPFPPVP